MKQAYAITKKPCIALDAGFYIEHWHGFPRAYVNPTLETLGLRGILKLMSQISNRRCEFKQCLAFYDGRDYKCFESVSKGTLSHEIRGQHLEQKWSELWSIFIPEHFNKTLSEFDDEDRQAYNKMAQPSSLTLFGQWYEVYYD